MEKGKDKERDFEEAAQPSQAEGDRETIEEDLGEKVDTPKAAQGKVIPARGETSQAEGERV
ncbi:MAG: hypothetical protein J0I20_35565 [Chloroflexi bacterium]|nr:hypothetical protein [Chloroflexota bacterium]OJV87325.1 MAG: hypothetical protein BGO39_12250 [Chloroflexi bacterium 54-19]